MSTAPSDSRTQWQLSKALASLAWPIVGINVLQVLAFAIDTAMVGRLDASEVALTGLGYATQIVFLLMVAMWGLTIGTVALVARAHGAGKHDDVGHIFHQSTQLTVVLGLLVAVVGNAMAPYGLMALGGSPQTIDASLAYLVPLLLGTVFNYLNILFAATLRGLGSTRVAFAVALGMNALNIVFNYALILGNWGFPSLGLMGAAIGTVLSQACAAFVMWFLLHRGVVEGVRPVFALRRVDVPLTKRLFAIGWPASLDMVVINAAFLSIIGMLGRIDQAAVAAHAIGLRVQAVAFVPGMSLSQATGALVGQALGAGKPEEARKILGSSVAMSLVVMTSLTAVIIAFSDPLIALFGVDPNSTLGQYSAMWLLLLGLGMPLAGVAISFGGLFQGAGATRVPLAINVGAHLLFQVPMSFLLGFPLGLGVWGVWAAFPASFLLKIVASVWAYRRTPWDQTGVSIEQ